MNSRLETKLKYIWCLMSVFSLLLPLYPNYFADSPETFGNIMIPALIVLFVVSFPISFFAIPLFVLFKFILEIEPNEMFGAYLYLGLFNIIGFIQWFWLMPKIFGNSKPFNLPSIVENN
jgi:drug/metabolite transporter (DMT)-like permease